MRTNSFRTSISATGLAFLLIVLCLSARTQTQLKPDQKPIQPAKVIIQAPQFQAKETDYQQLQKDLAALEKQRQELLSKLQAFDQKQQEVLQRLEQLEKFYDAGMAGESQAKLLEATRSMQEAQMSFNLQYLQLQNQMQHENRSYTAISNIMKTKHDTVKNSISNIR